MAGDGPDEAAVQSFDEPERQNPEAEVASWEASPGPEPREDEGPEEEIGDRPNGKVIVRTRPKRTGPYRENRSRYENGGSPEGAMGDENYSGGNESSPAYSGRSRGRNSYGRGQVNSPAMPPQSGSPSSSASAVLPLPALPKNFPSMPDIYGRPEPRLDQDNGKPRLSFNELIRLYMIDLRELAACYNISHEDMVALKKQEIIFSILKAHTERGG
ncbi:MAG: Rho termination factor N-terminal domain-containing protein, partial [Treponema sp.]|nr:Rho termination factor N-terminal domain-containing protein [Treponema sp.]